MRQALHAAERRALGGRRRPAAPAWSYDTFFGGGFIAGTIKHDRLRRGRGGGRRPAR
ncbi:MAG: hypothetical protein R2749_25745 [Acidimicrobiales bacterium]